MESRSLLSIIEGPARKGTASNWKPDPPVGAGRDADEFGTALSDSAEVGHTSDAEAVTVQAIHVGEDGPDADTAPSPDTELPAAPPQNGDDRLIEMLDAWSGVSAALSADPAPGAALADSDDGSGVEPAAPPRRETAAAILDLSVPDEARMSDTAPAAPPKGDRPSDAAVAEPEVRLDKDRAATAAPKVENAPTDQAPPARASLTEVTPPLARPDQAFTPVQPIAPFAVATRLFEPPAQIIHPPAVLRQVADAVVTMRPGSLEIALSPEELGRVRLVVTGAERAAMVTVWVERPEVLDLLRRHGGLLSEHFAEAGMGDAGFEFREEARHGSTSDRMPGPDGTNDPAVEQIRQVSLPGTPPPSGDRRLDLRL